MLFWAFDRWSSSSKDYTRRGTRGLYRVDRIVKKYQGLVTLRCENHSIGMDHGGTDYDKKISNIKRLPFLPGTIIRLWLPTSKKQLPARRVIPQTPDDLIVYNLLFDGLSSQGLSSKNKKQLAKYLHKAIDGKPLCLLLTVKGQLANMGQSTIEDLIKDLVEERHPATIVLYSLPGGWDTILNAVDSINQEHEKSKHGNESYGPDHFEIWDPILILGRPGEFVWAGASKIHRKILTNLFNAQSDILTINKLQRIVQDDQTRQSIWRDFRNDTSLIRCLPDYSLELRINLGGILSAIRKTIQSQIVNYIRKANGSPQSGVSRKGIYLTPSLVELNRWLDVSVILEKTCGVKSAMLLIANLIKQYENISRLNNKANFIFFDSTVSPNCQKYLKDYLQIHDSDINLGETGPSYFDEFHVIPASKFVVVHCDIIVSGEAVERSLYQTYRDDASVIVVSCIVDSRKNSTERIEIWGKEVPVFSIACMDMFSGIDEKDNKSYTVISPITLASEQIKTELYKEEKKQTGQQQLSQIELNDLLKQYHALHFNHIGRPIGRHFTFYFDATKIAEDSKVIRTFNSAIDYWINEELPEITHAQPQKIEIWYPSPEPKPPAPAHRLVEQIARTRDDVKITKPIRRVPAYGRWTLGTSQSYKTNGSDVVIIDWGALTGSTIMQMIRIAEQAGANSIYVCILLCQLQEEEEYFLTHLNSFLSNKFNNGKSNNRVSYQPKLPGFGSETIEENIASDNLKKIEPLPIKVKFLSKSTLRPYRSSSCPICKQIKRYQKQYYPTSLLEKFAKKQRKNLLRRDRGIVLERKPCDFAGKEHDIEELIWMKDFQHKLELALSSTYGRKQIHDFIESTLLGLANKDTKCLQEASYFVHLLSVEQHWLKTSPLKLLKTKQLLSEVCLNIITNENVRNEDPKIRAIIVLSASNIVFLAKEIENIFNAALNFGDCLEQLLYELFDCDFKSFTKDAETRKSSEILLKFIKQVIKDYNIQTIPLPVECFTTIMVLHNRFEYDVSVIKSRHLKPSRAWNDLKEEYQHQYRTMHNQVARSMRLILPGMDEDYIDSLIINNEKLDERFVESYIKRLKDNWRPCRDFIDNTIFPKLHRFKDVMSIWDARNALGPHTTNKLADMLTKRIPIAESDFSQLIYKLDRNPNSILDKANWDTFKTESAWIWKTFLKPLSQDGTGAALLKFLQSAPVEIGPIFCSVYNEVKSTRIGSDQHAVSIKHAKIESLGEHAIKGKTVLSDCNFKVFCTKDLLIEIFREVLLNCAIHREDNHQDQMIIFVEAIRKDENIFIRICNSGSIETSSGKGLDLLEERLLPFGAKLKRNNRPENKKYSYEVIVEFQDGGIY